MSTTTKSLGLTKPDAAENYSVDVYNANWDRLDAALALVEGTISAGDKGAVMAQNSSLVRYGRLVVLALRVHSLTSSGEVVVARIPEGFRPRHGTYLPTGTTGTAKYAYVTTSGDVCVGGTNSGAQVFVDATWLASD